MSLRETLSKIENLVVHAAHIPLTEKAIINDNDLIHYVEELRRDLPAVINNAEKVMQDKDNIIGNAKREAERMKDEAVALAEHLAKEETIYKKAEQEAENIVHMAKEHSTQLISEAEKNAKTLQEQAREKALKMVTDADEYSQKIRTDTDNYAKTVFDQLIGHVAKACQNVDGISNGLGQSLQVLQTARENLEYNEQNEVMPSAER